MGGYGGGFLSYLRAARPCADNPDPLARRYPHTEHGKNDASTDEQVIRDWWRRWPNAVPSIVTQAGGSPVPAVIARAARLSRSSRTLPLSLPAM